MYCKNAKFQTVPYYGTNFLKLIFAKLPLLLQLRVTNALI